MTLSGDAIVWAFDGCDGRDGGLRAMIGFYQSHLRELLPPPSDSAADDAGTPTAPQNLLVKLMGRFGLRMVRKTLEQDLADLARAAEARAARG